MKQSPGVTNSPDEGCTAQDANDDDACTTDDSAVAHDESTRRQSRWRRVPTLILAGILICAALVSLLGWLAVQCYRSDRDAKRDAEYLQTARQGAVNLTTIDWKHAEADVDRIVDGATGQFHEEFSSRATPFIEMVKKVQSTTEGTVTAAGIESATDTEARALVAVSVRTVAATPDQDSGPRFWRMRIDLQKSANEILVSNVEFVP